MQDTSSKQQTKIQTQPSADRLLPHSASPIRGKTNKQKNSAQISPYMKLTQTTGPILGGQNPKARKNLTFFKETIQLSLKSGKGHLKQNKLKKNEKAEKYCTNEGTT